MKKIILLRRPLDRVDYTIRTLGGKYASLETRNNRLVQLHSLVQIGN